MRFLSRRYARLETFRPHDSLGDHGVHRKLAVDLEPGGVKNVVKKVLQEQDIDMPRWSRAWRSRAREPRTSCTALYEGSGGLCMADLEVKKT